MVKQYTPAMGDIIFVSFDPSLGHEQKGSRPALVVSADVLSKTSPFAWVVPITHGKWDYPTHVKLDDRTKTDGQIYVEQLTTIDYKNREIRFFEKVPADILDDVLYMIHQLTKRAVK